MSTLPIFLNSPARIAVSILRNGSAATPTDSGAAVIKPYELFPAVVAPAWAPLRTVKPVARKTPRQTAQTLVMLYPVIQTDEDEKGGNDSQYTKDKVAETETAGSLTVRDPAYPSASTRIQLCRR